MVLLLRSEETSLMLVELWLMLLADSETCRTQSQGFLGFEVRQPEGFLGQKR